MCLPLGGDSQTQTADCVFDAQRLGVDSRLSSPIHAVAEIFTEVLQTLPTSQLVGVKHQPSGWFCWYSATLHWRNTRIIAVLENSLSNTLGGF